MSDRITFQTVRDGASVRTDPQRSSTFILPAVTAAEVFNPRRVAPMMASRRIEMRADAVYRVNFGFVLDENNFNRLLFAPHQLSQSIVLACGMRLLNISRSPASELIAYVTLMSVWTLDENFPLLELLLANEPVVVNTGANQTDSVVTATGPVTVEPSSKPNATESVGKAVSIEVTDEKFKSWLDDDKDAAKQHVVPTTATNFPPIGALPARIKAVPGNPG